MPRAMSTACVARRRGGTSAGRDGQVEDVVVVRVFDDAPVGEVAVDAAGGDDGNLAFEVDERFEIGSRRRGEFAGALRLSAAW